ncbi:MAG: hypothetical protein IJ297_03115 [Clostridia bacterium]|nr:hypothetical protein [Clostridia bacterium]
MRKNVPTFEVNEPPEEAVVMNKAEIPIQGSSVQHIGGWKGMNKRATFDSGALSEAVNVTFRDFPNVESSRVPEVIKTFKFTERVETEGTDEEGNAITTVTWEDRLISKVYDCVTRGDELFLACDKGYVYGKMVDGKLCYIAAGDARSANLPKEKVRLTFVETYKTETIAVDVQKNVCVFNSDLDDVADTNYMPVFPAGSVEVVDKFLPLLWDADAESDIDTSRIYVIFDENGKADQVWKYFSSVPYYCEQTGASRAAAVWVELRRQVFAQWLRSENEVRFSYFEKSKDCNSSSTYDSGYIGNKIKTIKSLADLNAFTILDIDEMLANEGIRAYDDINGTACAGETYMHLEKSPGIFNYEETVAPEFEHVTFYKGRVFGSVGSTVICSEYNNYNGWELDTTTDISSEHAWLTTTTANANADGSIVAIREYLGKISVLKSGFMQEVYGGSNPFTIQDVYAVGTPFPQGICEAYGRLCFCGKNAIRTYGGSFPRVIGDELGVDMYEDVQMLGNDRSVLIKTGEDVYKYDFLLGMWEERSSDYFKDIGKMIVLSGEMYAVTNTGELVKLEGENYGAWSFTTDAMTENTLSLKRLQKVRITYELGAESGFTVQVVKNTGEKVNTASRVNNTGKIQVQRCEFSLTNVVDWFLKLRFTGSGYFKLISMDVEIKSGGALTYE